MKIAIDLDDVIKDTLNSVLEFYHETSGRRFYKKEFTSYNWWEVWNITKEEAIKVFYAWTLSKNYDETPCIEGAQEALALLAKKYHLIILTSRPLEKEKQTRKWLEANLKDISYELVHSGDFYNAGSLTKAQICKDLETPLILEDNGDYALECAQQGIKSILFDRPWNQKYEHSDMSRVCSWQEAVLEIEKSIPNP